MTIMTYNIDEIIDRRIFGYTGLYDDDYYNAFSNIIIRDKAIRGECHKI